MSAEDLVRKLNEQFQQQLAATSQANRKQTAEHRKVANESGPESGPRDEGAAQYVVDEWGQGWWGDGTPDVSNWPSS